MRQLHSLLSAFVAAGVVWASGPPHVPAVARQENQPDLVGIFNANVEAYVALHRRLEAPLPRLEVTSDPWLLSASKMALAAALRRERAAAQQGEIFTQPVAAMFRQIVNRSLRDAVIDVAAILADQEPEVADASPLDVRINADYPGRGRSVSCMPPTLLKALPPLPPELQYRFAGPDLILWDVHAGLIVDFVPSTLRGTTE